MRAGASWRMLPHDFPPWEAVYQQAQRWLSARVFEAMVHDLRALLGLAEGRSWEPTAAILDSRTLRSSPESGYRVGYDGAKRKKGSKVHAAVDTLGHLLALHVTPADEQDRAEVETLACAIQQAIGENVDLAYVDQGYSGEEPAENRDRGEGSCARSGEAWRCAPPRSSRLDASSEGSTWPRRIVDAAGYSRLKHWRIHAEEGLARCEVAVWLGEDDLVIEYGGDTLSRYDVSFSPGASKLRILHQSAVGLGIPLVPQFGDETDDALRQNIGLLERRKMATRLRNRPAPEIEESLRQRAWEANDLAGALYVARRRFDSPSLWDQVVY